MALTIYLYNKINAFYHFDTYDVFVVARLNYIFYIWI